MIDRDLEDQGAKKPMVLEKPKHNQNETKQ